MVTGEFSPFVVIAMFLPDTGSRYATALQDHFINGVVSQ